MTHWVYIIAIIARKANTLTVALIKDIGASMKSKDVSQTNNITDASLNGCRKYVSAEADKWSQTPAPLKPNKSK